MRATTDIVEEADSSTAQRASPDCMMSHVLLRNVDILDLSLSAESRVGEALDVRIEGGRITEIGEGLASTRPSRRLTRGLPRAAVCVRSSKG